MINEKDLSMITPEELVLMYQETDDKRLKNILFKAIKENFGKLIRCYTKGYNKAYGIENEECVSLMLLALLRAIEKFDTKYNVKFISFYIRSIKNHLGDYAKKLNSTKIKQRKKNLQEQEKFYLTMDNLKSELIEEVADKKEDFDTFAYDLNRMKNIFTENEYIVLNTYVYNDLSFKEIAEILKLSQVRVFQIFNTAVEKVKKEYFTD